MIVISTESLRLTLSQSDFCTDYFHWLHREVWFGTRILVQVSCHYHDWLWSYDNFRLLRIDQKSGNQKYPHLSFGCPISGDWGELGIRNLARIFLIKCYWMLQNARVTPLTVSESLRKNQRRGVSPTQVRVKALFVKLEVGMRFKALRNESNTRYCIMEIHQW